MHSKRTRSVRSLCERVHLGPTHTASLCSLERVLLVRNRLRELGVHQEYGLKDLIELCLRFGWSARSLTMRVVGVSADEPHLVGQLALLRQKDGRRSIGCSSLRRFWHLRLVDVTHGD